MRRSIRPAGAAFPAVLALIVLTGCSGHGSAGAAPASPAAQSASPVPSGRPCGMGKTAAGVPVQMQVVHGAVGCPAALKLQRAYAAEVASGKAPGNGGGGPITVLGWVCVGFDTPEILRTGDTSKCTRDGAEIVAVLPSPSASPSS
jgi:hypothetical protein